MTVSYLAKVSRCEIYNFILIFFITADKDLNYFFFDNLLNSVSFFIFTAVTNATEQYLE